MHFNVVFSFDLDFLLPLFLQFQFPFGSWLFVFALWLFVLVYFIVFVYFCLSVSLCCLESCLVCYRVLPCPALYPDSPASDPLLPGSSSPLSRVKSLVLWVPTWRLDWCVFWDSLQATGSLWSCLSLPLELPPPCSSPLPPRTGSVVIPPAHIVLSALPLWLDWFTSSPSLLFLVNVLSINYICPLICILSPISCRSLTVCLLLICSWPSIELRGDTDLFGTNAQGRVENSQAGILATIWSSETNLENPKRFL